MKTRKGIPLLASVVLLVFCSQFVFAQNRVVSSRAAAEYDSNKPITVVEKHTYRASDIDSKVSARAYAIAELKRLILEKVGTYIVSYTEVKNFKVEQDKVEAWTAGVTKLEILSENWNGETYTIEAKIVLNPEEVLKALEAVKHDVQLAKELEKSKLLADQARADNEKLKNELEQLKAGVAFSQEMKDLSAKRAEGEKYLTMAMEAAKHPGQDAQADRLEKKAIELLGEAYVRNIWQKEIFYAPSDVMYRFPYMPKSGEQTNFWIRMAKDTNKIQFHYGPSNCEYLVEQASGQVTNKNTWITSDQERAKLRIKVIDNCKFIGMVVSK